MGHPPKAWATRMVHFHSRAFSQVTFGRTALLMLLAAILFFTLFPASRQNVISQHSTVDPEWRIGIQGAIGNHPVGVIWGRARESEGKPTTSLWFISNNVIIATFVTQATEKQPKLSRRNSQDNTSLLRLRAVLLDAITGKIVSTTDWPTESRHSLIVAAHEGTFVTQRGNELTLYDSNLQNLRTTKLPPLDSGDWYAHTSPTGKSVLFYSQELRKGRLVWLETEALKILGSWDYGLGGFLTVSDEKLATVSCFFGAQLTKEDGVYVPLRSSADRCESKLMMRGISTGWETVAPDEPQVYLQFINDDTLFMSGTLERRLIRTDGTVLFEEKNEPRLGWGFGCWGARGVPSADGRRLVIPSCEIKGASLGLDEGGHEALKRIAVYDVKPQVSSYILDVRGPKIKDEMYFAVSPDGSRIAVLNNGFVEVFSLP